MSISYGGDYITDTDGGKLRPSSAVFRNRILNGGMVIDQRNAGAAVTSSGGYPVDRWVVENTTTSGTFSAQQDSSAPAGFVKSLKTTITATDASLSGYERLVIRQIVEGYNIADLNWGSASAKTVCLSFWVNCSVTGTFGGSLHNGAEDRSYPFEYTISATNTWEQKSITITGDTTGTWLTTNGKGIFINLSLGAASTPSGTANAWTNSFKISTTGATNLVATSGATFYITGVQLEVGSSATGYEYRNYQQELAMCQRYYWKKAAQPDIGYTMIGAGMMYANTDARACLANPVVMRTYPAITFSGSGFGFERANSSIGTVGSPTSAYRSPEASMIYSGSGSSTGTAGDATMWYVTDNTSYISVSAEL